MAADTFNAIARQFGEALAPLRILKTVDGRAELLSALGYAPPPGGDVPALNAIEVSTLIDALLKLDLSAGIEVQGGNVELGLYADVVTALKATLGKIRELPQALQAQLPADYLTKTRIQERLPQQLLDLLLVKRINAEAEWLYDVLLLLGVIRIEPIEPDPVAFTIRHVRVSVAYGRITELLGDPPTILRSLGWGSSQFNASLLLALAGQLLRPLAARIRLRPLPKRVEVRLLGAMAAQADAPPLPQLLASFDRGLDPALPEIGLTAFGLRPSAPGALDGGIAIAPILRNTTEARFTLAPGLALSLDTKLDVQSGLVISIRPGKAPVIQNGVTTGGAIGTTTGQVLLRLEHQRGQDAPIALLKIPGGSRLEIRDVAVSAGFRAGLTGQPEFAVELEFKRARFVLSLSEGSGLLSAILPKDSLQAELDLAIGLAPDRAYLRGSARLEANFPVHLSLGPVDVQSLTVALTPQAGGTLPVEISATLQAALGPLTLTVERVGFNARLAITGGVQHDLGPVDVGLDFRFPAGIGVRLDAGPVTGGGYLSLDPAGKRYAGALRLKLPVCEVAAYGIYEEIQRSSSFVAVLGIRLNPAIQLGFGFALTGVGGLIGTNRRANVDVLRDRLATGASGNVLFCEDPLKNAPALLGDLGQFFPPAPSGFVVGPTLQISWLSPIVRLDIGIMIEFPGPSKIAILGTVRAVIGLGDALALLYLRMDVLGVIDFEQRLVAIDASLVASHALGVFRLTGGMAFRLGYGSNPYVLLSIGGFHPRFDPGPLNIPRLARVGASLDVSVLARLYVRLELYTAFTSNTLQAGAKVEAGLELGPLAAHGFFQFDALIQFRPFHFEVEFAAGFSVEVFGWSLASVDISGRISGPGPIVIYARGTVRRFGLKVSASATFELGSRDGDRPAPIAHPVVELAPELQQVANLRAEGDDHSVVLLPGRSAVSGVLVSPVGSLVWEQKRAPLATILHRLGGVPLDAPHELHLDPPAGWSSAEERDWFNPGTFTDLDLRASQTLNNAGFQELPSGIRLGNGVHVRAPTEVDHQASVELVKRPERTRAALIIGAYVGRALQATMRDRTTTPGVDPGASKVTVVPETADVHGPGGKLLHGAQTPFQAFQLARSGVGRVAVPASDVTVLL